MFAGFEVVPAIDIQDGETVQLVGGERGTETSYGDPATAAKRWVEAGAKTLHVVDLDGAFDGERGNADAVASIREAIDVPIQLGGGIRSAAQARDLLATGIDRVILGTAAVQDPQIVRKVADSYPDGVLVGLDAADGEVVVSGWTEETGLDPVRAAHAYAELGAAGILFTDVDVEGKQSGVRTERVQELASSIDIPVVASGGVGTVGDVVALRDAGAAACVVGTALYEGTITLSAAQEAIEADER